MLYRTNMTIIVHLIANVKTILLHLPTTVSSPHRFCIFLCLRSHRHLSINQASFLYRINPFEERTTCSASSICTLRHRSLHYSIFELGGFFFISLRITPIFHPIAVFSIDLCRVVFTDGEFRQSIVNGGIASRLLHNRFSKLYRNALEHTIWKQICLWVQFSRGYINEEKKTFIDNTERCKCFLIGWLLWALFKVWKIRTTINFERKLTI